MTIRPGQAVDCIARDAQFHQRRVIAYDGVGYMRPAIGQGPRPVEVLDRAQMGRRIMAANAPRVTNLALVAMGASIGFATVILAILTGAV